ncbi:MAG: 3-deoxy-8-phosphooctulonate synthase [Opitutia bacterium]|jgi:2-dehydro-3-deoxyphosphooctonate aldolase (KDO 8-P synthase)
MIHDKRRLLLIAGPCSLESESNVRAVAKELRALADREPDLNLVFKGSYDKANRTSLQGDRGPGLEAGLALLEIARKDYRFPILTDVHGPDQCAAVGKVADVLQIPAFMCRQTDLLVAAARTGKVVNVKKGQFLSPFEMRFVVDKLAGAGAAEIWQTDRGTTFGYQNLVVDMRAFPIMAANGWPTIMDATHAVQLPGAAGGSSGGQREFVPVLARAALAAGADGLFMETHPDPAKAISDGPSQVPLDQFAELVQSCLRIWRAARA